MLQTTMQQIDVQKIREQVSELRHSLNALEARLNDTNDTLTIFDGVSNVTAVATRMRRFVQRLL